MRRVLGNRRLASLIALSLGASTAFAAAPEADAPIALSLKEATERALANSHALQKARRDLDASEAGIDVAWSGFLPTLHVESTVGTLHDRQPNPGESQQLPLVARDRNQYDGQLILDQPLFSGFKDMASLNANEAARNSSTLALKQAAIDTTMQVITLYFSIQLARSQLRAEEEIASLRSKQLEEVANRYRLGRSTQLEKLEAEYARQSENSAIRTLEVDIEHKGLQLARLIGLDVSSRFRLTDELENIAAVTSGTKPPPFAEGFAEALAQNPKVKKGQSDIDQVTWQAKADSAKHLPTVDLQLAYGTNSYLRADIASRDAMTYSGLLKVQVPIFSGLSSISEHRQQLLKLESLQEDLSSTREQLLTDLNDYYRNWEIAEEKIKAEEADVKLAAEAVSSARSLYTGGRATLSDVLNSYTRDLNAKKSLAQAYYDRLIALANIKAMMAK